MGVRGHCIATTMGAVSTHTLDILENTFYQNGDPNAQFILGFLYDESKGAVNDQ